MDELEKEFHLLVRTTKAQVIPMFDHAQDNDP